MKLGIWGWWQGNNLGDNWIKHVLSKYFPNASFLPTSVQEFEDYDFVICGGGGLFIYDVISPFNKIDIHVPYGILGMGAEFEHKSRLATELEKKAEFFFVRDEYSLKCMHLPYDCRSYDVTFLDPLEFESKTKTNKVFYVWRDGLELLKNNLFNDYIKYSDEKDNWDKFIETQFTEVIRDDFQTEEYDINKRMQDCGFVVSGRYHGIVAAIQKGIPFLAIDICPKIRALVDECGLSEYCIKISEVEKAEELIKKAKTDVDVIRKKEFEYRRKALLKLRYQMVGVQNEINKRFRGIKVLHYGSYWMGENDVVCAMSDDLLQACDAVRIDLRAYSSQPDSRIKSMEKTPNGMICKLNTELILKDVEEYKPAVIILNSGGLCFEKKLKNKLKKYNIKTIGISLSDPDVYPYNGARYATEFDYFFTNSKFSLNEQYDKPRVNISLLPFAASIKHHYYMENVEKIYDLVIVGHARKDRIRIVNELSKICKVGLFGMGWEDGQGCVKGLEQVRAINEGNMYLSFSHTQAGYENVKVGLFEAMACNQFVITSYMDEISDYFEIGKEIVCYKDETELIELVQYYTAHEEEREKIRINGYLRFLREHTYLHRWAEVIEKITR